MLDRPGVIGRASDRKDAIGIARIMQTGWFKEVRVPARMIMENLTPKSGIMHCSNHDLI